MENYSCKYCNKNYKTNNSRINHYNNIHKEEYLQDKTNELENTKTFPCNKCGKKYINRQSKYQHQKKCTLENNTELSKENNMLKNLIIDLIKNNKLGPEHLKNINNGTINNNIGAINNNNNKGNVNNITVNLQNFGNEDIIELLSRKEVLEILSKKLLSLEESVKTVHLNKNHPEYKNIIIKNIKNKYAYVWEEDKFIVKHKDDVLEDLISNHVNFIETSLETYKDFLSTKIQNKITEMLEKLESSSKYVNKQLHKTFKTYRTYKKEELKMLIYNNTKNETTIVVSFDNEEEDSYIEDNDDN
jgi:hypothetical protein